MPLEYKLDDQLGWPIVNPSKQHSDPSAGAPVGFDPHDLSSGQIEHHIMDARGRPKTIIKGAQVVEHLPEVVEAEPAPDHTATTIEDQMREDEPPLPPSEIPEEFMDTASEMLGETQVFDPIPPEAIVIPATALEDLVVKKSEPKQTVPIVPVHFHIPGQQVISGAYSEVIYNEVSKSLVLVYDNENPPGQTFDFSPTGTDKRIQLSVGDNDLIFSCCYLGCSYLSVGRYQHYVLYVTDKLQR